MKMIETNLTKKVKTILNSDNFLTTLIYGPTRCGKTFPIIETCKKMKLDYIRINLTNETDESTLMGNFRLENGNTIFSEGPVIDAMRNGKVLILDEIDSANPNNIMCLQSILEGDGYYIKRIKEFVQPHKNFKVFATANTKGKGDISGQYVTANILNEAFLERFTLFIETDYQTPAVERKIIMSNVPELNETIVDNFITWANATRKSSKENEFEIPITTGRLISIFKISKVFEITDPVKLLNFSLDRFESYERKAYVDLYESLFPVRKDPDNTENEITDQFNTITPF